MSGQIVRKDARDAAEIKDCGDESREWRTSWKVIMIWGENILNVIFQLN